MAHERRGHADFIFPTGGLRLNGVVAALRIGCCLPGELHAPDA
jgi:hypothetical protein